MNAMGGWAAPSTASKNPTTALNIQIDVVPDRLAPDRGVPDRTLHKPPRWIDAFFDVPQQVGAKLAAAAHERTFRLGETIIKQEDRAERLYMIKRGQVKLLLRATGREELLIAVLGDGDYFGEAPMLDSRPWPVAAVAMVPTETFVLERDVVMEVLSESPELASEFLYTFAHRLRGSYELMQDAIFLDVAGRLAKKLLDLSRDYGRRTDDGLVIDMCLTQQDLARMVGVTRESVNKHLGAFRARGIVGVRDRRIVVLRPDELQRRVV